MKALHWAYFQPRPWWATSPLLVSVVKIGLAKVARCFLVPGGQICNWHCTTKASHKPLAAFANYCRTEVSIQKNISDSYFWKNSIYDLSRAEGKLRWVVEMVLEVFSKNVLLCKNELMQKCAIVTCRHTFFQA